MRSASGTTSRRLLGGVLGLAMLFAGVAFLGPSLAPGLFPAPPADEPEIGVGERGEGPAPRAEVLAEPAGEPLDAEGARASEPEVLPDSGPISGTLQLAPELVGRFARFAVVWEEAVNTALPGSPVPRRHQRSFDLPRGAQRARFRLRNVRFSPYGWRVFAFVPGLNASEQIVALGPEKPEAEILLSLRPPVLLSVSVRDQDREPVPRIPLRLTPKGRPLGRGILEGETDLYGSVSLEKVREGEYELWVGPLEAPLLPPRRIRVPDRGLPHERVTLPRGGSIVFEVSGPNGLGLDEVEITAIAKDSKVFRRLVTSSKNGGKARFPHVKAGEYLVHFVRKGYTRGFEAVRVRTNEESRVTTLLNWAR